MKAHVLVSLALATGFLSACGPQAAGLGSPTVSPFKTQQVLPDISPAFAGFGDPALGGLGAAPIAGLGAGSFAGLGGFPFAGIGAAPLAGLGGFPFAGAWGAPVLPFAAPLLGAIGFGSPFLGGFGCSSFGGCGGPAYGSCGGPSFGGFGGCSSYGGSGGRSSYGGSGGHAYGGSGGRSSRGGREFGSRGAGGRGGDGARIAEQNGVAYRPEGSSAKARPDPGICTLADPRVLPGGAVAAGLSAPGSRRRRRWSAWSAAPWSGR
jgi:hypothetical protein